MPRILHTIYIFPQFCLYKEKLMIVLFERALVPTKYPHYEFDKEGTF